MRQYQNVYKRLISARYRVFPTLGYHMLKMMYECISCLVFRLWLLLRLLLRLLLCPSLINLSVVLTHHQLHAKLIQKPLCLALAPLLRHGSLLLPDHLLPLVYRLLPLPPHALCLRSLLLQIRHLLLPLLLILIKVHEPGASRPRLGPAVKVQLWRRSELLVPLRGQLSHLLRYRLVRIEGVRLHRIAIDDLLGHAGTSGEAVGHVVCQRPLAPLFAKSLGTYALARSPEFIDVFHFLLVCALLVRGRGDVSRPSGLRVRPFAVEVDAVLVIDVFYITSLQRSVQTGFLFHAALGALPRGSVFALLIAGASAVLLRSEIRIVEVGKCALLHVFVVRLEDVVFLRARAASGSGFGAIASGRGFDEV
ncbi:hypothetical protein B5807_00213 [Epicoccum nigrum]|uniref:Uncharacterized protein n=1 Tax=Epicoccum nigrum TaxID=105696 RepID=A0A1Y2MFF3_EPING|nr:hypothetical protein B5807_00213 [Epicoccum nigrum]